MIKLGGKLNKQCSISFKFKESKNELENNAGWNDCRGLCERNRYLRQTLKDEEVHKYGEGEERSQRQCEERT
jgi:hypothetical protein